MQPTLHRWWYCHQKFKVKGKEFTYLEADFEGIERTSVIRFTDGTKRYTMPEIEFFAKVKQSFALPK